MQLRMQFQSSVKYAFYANVDISLFLCMIELHVKIITVANYVLVDLGSYTVWNSLFAYI